MFLYRENTDSRKNLPFWKLRCSKNYDCEIMKFRKRKKLECVILFVFVFSVVEELVLLVLQQSKQIVHRGSTTWESNFFVLTFRYAVYHGKFVEELDMSNSSKLDLRTPVRIHRDKLSSEKVDRSCTTVTVELSATSIQVLCRVEDLGEHLATFWALECFMLLLCHVIYIGNVCYFVNG